LWKALPLSALDKTVKFLKNKINMGSYEDREELVWKVLGRYNI
jgi:hypothetical protein